MSNMKFPDQKSTKIVRPCFSRKIKFSIICDVRMSQHAWDDVPRSKSQRKFSFKIDREKSNVLLFIKLKCQNLEYRILTSKVDENCYLFFFRKKYQGFNQL